MRQSCFLHSCIKAGVKICETCSIDGKKSLCYTKFPFLLTEKRVFCQMPDWLVTAGIGFRTKYFPSAFKAKKECPISLRWSENGGEIF